MPPSKSVLFTFQRHLPLVGDTDLVKDSNVSRWSAP